MTKQKIYLACTPDKYELPIFIADTLDELSSLTGVKKQVISCLITRPRKNSYIFRRIEITNN